MRLRRLAFGLSFLAAVLLLASGPGVRLGLWAFTVGLAMLGAAGVVGLAAVVAAIVGLVRQGRGPVGLVVALVLGAVALSVLLFGVMQARSLPPINDISTDADNPPQVTAQQRRAYPDIQPLLLETSFEDAFSRARAAAEAMGWEIVSADARAGRIEAVASTFWFGFKDDVVVRVTSAGSRSRVDVRSKSRVGVSDVGTNAQRIRAYQKRLN